MERKRVVGQIAQLEKLAVAFSHAADRVVKAVEQTESKIAKDFQSGLGRVRDERREVEEVLQRGVKLTNKRFHP